MPAAYTYNDAIEDAKIVVAKAIGEAVEPLPEALAGPHVDLLLKIVRSLNDLKRRERRKRSRKPAPTGSPLDKILDEDRIPYR